MTTPARPRPRPRPIMALEVIRTLTLTPHITRVVLGGPGMSAYVHNAFTDRYVKLVFPPDGVTYPEPLDLAALRRDLPPEQWPKLRTYTIRSYDPDAGELSIDFVVHGDQGFAAPWARRARPGEQIHVRGPGGAYAPDPDADWHLFVGDEAAFPAIAAALTEVPGGAPIVAVLEAEDATEAGYLDLPERAEVHWLLRDRGQAGEGALTAAVAGLSFPAGRVHAFAHGELGEIRLLRQHLLRERGMPLEQVSISGYWRRGKDEDGFQAEKADEAAQAGP